MTSLNDRQERLSYSPVNEEDMLPSGYLRIPEFGPLTPQHISDFDHQRKLKRESMTIYNQPIHTVYLLLEGSVVLLKYSLYHSLTHPLMIYLLIPLISLWILFDYVGPQDSQNPYRVVVSQVEFYVEFCVWWIGLGILSSIGLGSGLQSGVLFMFPHIFRTCLAAQSCKSMNFESYSNMWFRNPSNLFKCPTNAAINSHHQANVTFFDMWRKVIVVCFLQALGTAIGEIPPYWMTRAARLAALESGGTTEDTDEIPEELETNSQYRWINRWKEWMVSFLQTHGFYGVLCMASFPNLAFDLCGICCGHYLMPFWTFFWATFLGKAIIRNSYQSVIYVALCSEQYLEWLIRALQFMAPDSLHIDQTIRQLLEEGRGSFQRLSTGESSTNISPSPSNIIQYIDISNPSFSMFIPNLHFNSVSEAFSFYWQIIFMRSILLLFILSCITQFAQYYQLTIDRQDSQVLRQRLPKQVIDTIISPVSGRLQLPPPSTKKKRRPKKLSSSGTSSSPRSSKPSSSSLAYGDQLSSNHDSMVIETTINNHHSSPSRRHNTPTRRRSQSGDSINTIMMTSSPRKRNRSTPVTPLKGEKI